MMFFWHNGWGFGGLIMILFWLIPIGFLVWAISRGSSYHQHNSHTRKNSAMNILNERYAKGEINKDEYEQKKKDLSQ